MPSRPFRSRVPRSDERHAHQGAAVASQPEGRQRHRARRSWRSSGSGSSSTSSRAPQEFVNVALDGLTRGSIYGVVALGYTLVYGILQLINFAHGDVFSLSGLVASTMLLSVLGLDRRFEQPRGRRRDHRHARDHDPPVRRRQRDDRAGRLPAAAQRAAADAADHRGRDVVHRLEHLARALRRRLRERLRAHPPGRRVRDRRHPHHVEARLRARDHHAGARSR